MTGGDQPCVIASYRTRAIAIVDAHAARLGISRSEYIRRRLAQDEAGAPTVGVADLQRIAEDFGDLADPDVMAQAWRL
jgi:hypothetical protein